MSGEGKQKEGASALMITLMQEAMFFVGGIMALCTFTGGMALAGIFLGWAFDGKQMIDTHQSLWGLDIVILYLIYGISVVGAVRSLKMVHVIFPDGAHLSTAFAWIRSAIGFVLFIVCIRYYWAGLSKAHSIWHQIAFWMGGLIFWFGYGATDVGEDWARFFLKLAPRPKAGGHGHAH